MSVIRCDLCERQVDTDIESTYEACEGCAVDYDDGQASEHPKLAELEKDRARLDWIMENSALCREAIDTAMEADR